LSESREWVHRVCFNAYFEDALAKYRAKTGYGITFAILNALNEYWYMQRCMSEEGYKFNKERYGLTLIENLKRNVKAEAGPVKEKPVKKEIPKKKYVDYSKLSDDELLERYRRAMLSNDAVAPQIIQFEAKKRGYQFREDNGNIRVVSIK
jgi:hypothetical protein